jgi:hypothetical protein
MVNGRAEMNLRLSTGGFQTVEVVDVTNPVRSGSSTQVRAISSTLTVKVTNDAGAVIQEINSAVTIEVLNANSEEPGRGTLSTPQFQLLGGQRSISQMYTFSEPILLVAYDDAGNSPATSNVITITPGPPNGIRLASDPTWVRGNRHATLSARVVDEYENGVPGESVSFTHVSGTGTLTPIDITTDETGVARADFLSPRQPELNVIRSRDVGRVQPGAAARSRSGGSRRGRRPRHQLSESVPSGRGADDDRLEVVE